MQIAAVNFIVKNNKELFLHSLFGLLIGYFILHPVSMVIHWVETNNSAFSWTELERVFHHSIFHSFSFHMMPMSLAFTALGLLVGLGSGIYYKIVKKKEYLLYGKRQLLQQSIPSLIADGKNEFIEFKASLRYDYRQIKTDKNIELIVLKEIAGFLNAKGGTLIIGVDDNGNILGLANDYWSVKKQNKEGFQQRIILLVSNSFGKDICSRIHFTFHTIQDREICALYIDPSPQPIYLNDGNSTKFYLRTGNVTNSLTTSETVKYLQTRGTI